MNFATGIRIKIGVEDNDAVVNNQKTMERNPFVPHVVEGFGEDCGIEPLAFGARPFPSRAWKVVGSDQPGQTSKKHYD
jgi:hypothetical protein